MLGRVFDGSQEQEQEHEMCFVDVRFSCTGRLRM